MKRKISHKEFKELDSDAKMMIIEQILNSEHADGCKGIIHNVPKRFKNGTPDEDTQIETLVKTLETKIFSENTELEYDDGV